MAHCCPKCSKTFSCRDSLTRHIKTLHDDYGVNRVTCEICGKSFSNQNHMARHRNTHDDPRTREVACTTCGKVCLSKDNLNTHIRRTHNVEDNTKLFACTYCEKRFWTTYKLHSHTRVHTGERPYFCPQCKHTFAEKGCRDKHVRDVHRAMGEQRKHLCHEPGCCKKYNNVQHLKRHMATHCTVRPTYPCSTCGKLYKSSEGLAYHVKHSHEAIENEHTCSYCDKTFLTSSQLGVHIRSHTGEVPYACRLCPKRFSRKQVLSNHETRFHAEARTHGCPQCGKHFKMSDDLKQHVETHKMDSERKWFPCNLCDKKLPSNHGLKRHMACHTDRDEYRHICPICSKKFWDAAKLKRHVVSHTGEKPHVCNECGIAFNLRDNLLRHQKTVHKETNPPN